MKVGILGLGLIGGSLARAYALEGHTVYAIQRNESMLSFAMLSGAVHGRLDETTIPECDLILLAIYPGGCADWLEKNAPLVSKDALVIDCCGIKREVCSRCFPLAERYGFTFVGGHPMAGTEKIGYPASRARMGAAITVRRPVTTMARLLAAPWISPISTAREVPAAWALVPMARPWARGSVIFRSFRKAGAITAPKMPVSMMVAMVMAP